MELIWIVRSYFTHVRAPYGVEIGVRVSRSGRGGGCPFGPCWALFRRFSRIFRIFGRILSDPILFLRFLANFCEFWWIFRRFLAGFGMVCSRIFAFLSKIAIL